MLGRQSESLPLPPAYKQDIQRCVLLEGLLSFSSCEDYTAIMGLCQVNTPNGVKTSALWTIWTTCAKQTWPNGRYATSATKNLLASRQSKKNCIRSAKTMEMMMCRNCGNCSAEHPYSMDDAIDAYEATGLKTKPSPKQSRA